MSNLPVGWYGVELFVDRDSRSDMFYPDAFVWDDATLVEVKGNHDTGDIDFEFFWDATGLILEPKELSNNFLSRKIPRNRNFRLTSLKRTDPYLPF